MPNLDELSNIVLRKRIPDNNQPAIDTDFFPNTQSGGYLSASPATPVGPRSGYRPGNLTMRFVGSGLNTDGTFRRVGPVAHLRKSFVGGTSDVGRESGEQHPVRLVRGAPALRQTSNSRYVINGDGTVTDQVTQLMWQRCRFGMSGADCTTRVGGIQRTTLALVSTGYGWRQAMRAAANSRVGGFGDWRVPNINELESLLDYHSRSVNSSAFPNFNFSVPQSASLGDYYSSGPTPVSAAATYYPTYARVWGFDFGSLTGRTVSTFRSTHLVYERTNSDEVVGSGSQAIFVRDVGPSGTPTPLVAPGSLLAIADDSQVRVSWTAVAGATGYRLYYSQSPIRAASPGGSPGVKKVQLSTGRAPTASNPFTVYELTNDKRYYFRVTAMDDNDVESAPSVQDSALPSKYPGGPRTRTK